MQRLTITKFTSIIPVLFFVLIIPSIVFYKDLIADLTTSRVAGGIIYSAMSIGVSFWFFWLGLRIGERRKSILTKTDTKKLIILSVLAYLIYVILFLFNRFALFYILWDCFGRYFFEMLVYRFPVLLYGIVFLVLGIFMYGCRLKLSGRKAVVYCGISAVIYSVCCVGAELVYNGLNEYHPWYSLIHAIAVFPLTGLILSVYGLEVKDYEIDKYKGLTDFLVYLCPSAIFIYVLKLFSSPILVLLYFTVMWFVYKKYKK